MTIPPRRESAPRPRRRRWTLARTTSRWVRNPPSSTPILPTSPPCATTWRPPAAPSCPPSAPWCPPPPPSCPTRSLWPRSRSSSTGWRTTTIPRASGTTQSCPRRKRRSNPATKAPCIRCIHESQNCLDQGGSGLFSVHMIGNGPFGEHELQLWPQT